MIDMQHKWNKRKENKKLNFFFLKTGRKRNKNKASYFLELGALIYWKFNIKALKISYNALGILHKQENHKLWKMTEIMTKHKSFENNSFMKKFQNTDG